MSRFIFILVFFVSVSAGAQEISDNALGLRLGDSDGFGAEISYQRLLNHRDRRLEVDLGWRDSRNYSAIKLAGLYQWVRPIDGIFNWYYGVGGGLGSVHFDSNPNLTKDDDGIFLFGAGDIGVECNFDFPLLLSLDFRPELGILGYSGFSDNFDFDIALGVRYQF